MLYKFFIFVEGSNDTKFFKKILKNFDSDFFEIIKIIEWASKTNEEINNFLKTISQVANFDYLFFADMDDFPCITSKKTKLKERYSEIDIQKILIVIKEIESWYLAGLDKNSSKKLSIKHQKETNNITKEMFEELKPNKILYLDILEYFSIETAIQKNNSFKYFKESFDIIDK